MDHDYGAGVPDRLELVRGQTFLHVAAARLNCRVLAGFSGGCEQCCSFVDVNQRLRVVHRGPRMIG